MSENKYLFAYWLPLRCLVWPSQRIITISNNTFTSYLNRRNMLQRTSLINWNNPPESISQHHWMLWSHSHIFFILIVRLCNNGQAGLSHPSTVTFLQSHCCARWPLFSRKNSSPVKSYYFSFHSPTSAENHIGRTILVADNPTMQLLVMDHTIF